MSVDAFGSVVVRQITDKFSRTYTVLGLLGPIDSYTSGIVLTGKVDMPTGFSGGNWFFTQIITPGRWQAEANDQNRQKLIWNGCLCLDQDYQWGWNNTGNSDSVNDFPFIGLVGDEIDEGNWVMHEGNEVYNIYIMFHPPGTDVRDVPLRYVQWTWKGMALKGPLRWYLDSGSGDQLSTESTETTLHPQWIHQVSRQYVPDI
jgi:hypothetical protein